MSAGAPVSLQGNVPGREPIYSRRHNGKSHSMLAGIVPGKEHMYTSVVIVYTVHGRYNAVNATSGLALWNRARTDVRLGSSAAGVTLTACSHWPVQFPATCFRRGHFLNGHRGKEELRHRQRYRATVVPTVSQVQPIRRHTGCSCTHTTRNKRLRLSSVC